MKPILFNAEMVRAVLNGRKTVTRRIKKTDKAPYNVGDILYVRETWCGLYDSGGADGKKYAYKADATAFSEQTRNEFGYKWRPSIHMPKEAARIFLRVKSVTAEHLRDITVEEMTKEGFVSPCCMCRNEKDGKCPGSKERLLKDCPIESIYCPFRAVWNSAVKKSDLDRYGWDADPVVWVIEFERAADYSADE